LARPVKYSVAPVGSGVASNGLTWFVESVGVRVGSPPVAIPPVPIPPVPVLDETVVVDDDTVVVDEEVVEDDDMVVVVDEVLVVELVAS
jgi:hypothetical protein